MEFTIALIPLLSLLIASFALAKEMHGDLKAIPAQVEATTPHPRFLG